MKKYFLLIIIFLFSCSPTEPVETHDDNAILQLFLNIADPAALESLRNEFDLDENETLDCIEFPNTFEGSVNCTMENGRFTTLKLSNIGLSGPIPENIGNLTELTHLGLTNNNLTGEIPQSIGNLTKLRQLSLAKNNLSGSIPDTVGNLESLTNLVLTNNQFTGSLPNSIGNLTNLHTLLADSNNLSGTIPDNICTIFPNFIAYNIAYNQFCPPFPECIDAPVEEVIYQDCNCETGFNLIDGYCYSETDLNVLQSIINNSNADSLNIDMDKDSSGTIENLELGSQTWSAGRLERLNCFSEESTCNISGQIPDNIGELDKLKVLSLQVNNLSGEIPEEIGNLSELERINLAYNNLSGEVPESILNLPNLISFTVGENQLGGSIPENICIMFTIMDTLNLSNNKFCPCYPKCTIQSDQYDYFINTLNDQNITDCSSCNEGYTPELICDNLPGSVIILGGDSLCFKTDNLAVLDTFIYNSLDTLPESLDMSMDTDGSDDIRPLELGEQKWANGKLLSLNASNRGLSGSIPQDIGNLDSLSYLDISDNHLSGELPDGIYTLLNLQSLHISGNQLSGEILPAACLRLDNWETNGDDSERSYLDNNKFCPGEEGYPECIEPYIGEQETTGCN